MESSSVILVMILGAMCVFLLLVKLVFVLWVWPLFVYRKLRVNGFSGPKPNFPLGNLNYMKKMKEMVVSLNPVSNHIHRSAFPYFFQWQELYGKVFVYWLGTEPFLYIADPEFLRQISEEISGKDWGKPDVFKDDRYPMFGKGLLMVEGEDWVLHRRIISPAFSTTNLKDMVSLIVESGTKMVERWAAEIISGRPGINAEDEIIKTAGEIIARTSFGISFDEGQKVLEKLREMQITLFKSSRLVGVPLGKFLNLKNTLKARSLGREIDGLLHSIITDRISKPRKRSSENDLLGVLLADDNLKNGVLTVEELVDECKTFFFGGHETTALALTWTLLLLGRNPEWQEELREEIKEVIGDADTIDASKVARLKKVEWVLKEVLRLYPPAPNVQRQARQDIQVGDKLIPKGTNIWIDIVSMHHDDSLWGNDVHDFKPERFRDDPIHGGCNNKTGYIPFGFGGRICIGQNLAKMEYKIILSLIISKFSFSISPGYSHSPTIMLSLRPMHGLSLILKEDHPLFLV